LLLFSLLFSLLVFKSKDVIYFIIYNYFIINDWGNEHLLEIIKRVDGWPCYANINTASGYFKAIIRCNENDNKEWFWALEWNKYFRVIGLIADKMIKQKIFDNLPVIKTYSIGNDIFFKEKPIEKNKDFLFSGTVVEEIYGV